MRVANDSTNLLELCRSGLRVSALTKMSVYQTK